MNKSKPQEKVVIEYTDWSKFLPWLTQLAVIFAIGLVLARATMLETLREPFGSLSSPTAPPRACGPACSLVLDLFCCVPALLVLLRRVLDKTYIVRFTWAQALLCAFAVWALLSTLWAGDKFQSLVLAFHLVGAAALFWSMAQLVRSWVRLRLVAGACMGLLLVIVAQGLMYRFMDLPETIKYWKDHRSEEMRAHGWQEGDYALKQYEQKLMNGEMIGFQASPNTLAATLVLLGVVVAGVGIQRIVNKDESGLIGLAFVPLPLAGWIIWFTHSNAAFVSPVIAIGILLIVWKFGGALSRKRRLTFALGVFAIVLGTVALVGHGVFHGSLPSASLNFRWRYWVASARIFKAHPLLGVGYGNFEYPYLAARVPAAAEEVKDPHNLLVRAATELGIVGAILMIAWLVRVWWEWTLSVVPPAPERKTKETHPTRQMFFTIASLATLGVVINILAGIDLSADAGWVSFELLKRIVFTALLLIGLAIVVIRSSKDASMDDRPAPWVLYTMLAGLAVFLIHNTIDFSFFEIGPMMLCMMIGGAVLGARSPSAAGLRKRTPVAIAAFSTLLLAWLVALIFLAVPLIEAENRAYAGDNAVRRQEYTLAAENYHAAFTNAPVRNADYEIRAARALMGLPNSDGATRVDLALAIESSPLDPMGYLMRARYNLERHPDERDQIRRDYEKALGLNPNDLDTRLEYAKVLETFGDSKAAAVQYRLALKTNEGFDPAEPKRLSEAQVQEITRKLSG